MTNSENPEISIANSPDTGVFANRHIGPNQSQTKEMLAELQVCSLSELSNKVIPKAILHSTTLSLPKALSEQQALNELKSIADQNSLHTSLLGQGYHGTVTPPVIQRNVLENPAWYTAYTPYQPEIAQGRLEGLLNYQQMIMDLTGMEMANASMLDEATAAAEAMAMAKRQLRKNASRAFFVDRHCHPQTIAVVQTRAEHFGFEIIIGDPTTGSELTERDYFAALLQNPGSGGQARDLSDTITSIHAKGALAIVAADLMSLVIIKSPGAMGADIVVGTNQRFGIPMGFGGPHAGFFAFRADYKRSAPGRIIGVSIDQHGEPALRMAMQTREQHIRREKANSNICTAQVLLALMSAFYAMYHGRKGLRRIAQGIHRLTNDLAAGLKAQGYQLRYDSWFDTLTVETPNQQPELIRRAEEQHINLRGINTGANNKGAGEAIAISLDETSDLNLVDKLLDIFADVAFANEANIGSDKTATSTDQHQPRIGLSNKRACSGLSDKLLRQDAILSHPVFNLYHSESEMLRYLKRLENRDISLANSMIPLGSCTMKLNATAEMMPISWPEFANIHPFAPATQTKGYQQLISELEDMLIACTGYDAVSLQPNAGSQGEYAGLIAIKKHHQHQGEHQRDICLIPASAHGTNPASAQMAGMKVVVVKCNDQGDIDIADLRDKADKSGDHLAALMVTYPSTHGVFESGIIEVCQIIHDHGGQIYIDGANLNAMVGLAEPGKFGGDVSHINLHKTFCIPHGGGGPGMGPIAVAEHLKPFLPGHPLISGIGYSDNDLNSNPNSNPNNTDSGQNPETSYTISAAPWGSASILPISWMYIKMMGPDGLKRASQVAILNANYIAHKLKPHYPVLYNGQNGFVAHECIIDIRPLKESSGITEEDIAKRLMDYGFHAPTMSFPVPGTLMIEPTESESKTEIDRFIEAMVKIRKEIANVESGQWDEQNNPLRNAPHTLNDVLSETWDRPYSREQAARPATWQHKNKIWPSVNRIDNVYGDRNLVCSCPPLSAYQNESD